MAQRAEMERRSWQRVTVVQDLYFDSRESRPLVDLSEQGMFVATDEPYTVGSILDVRFRLLRDEHTISAKAQVVYTQEGLGMGLKFVDISHSDRERIRKFIERLLGVD